MPLANLCERLPFLVSISMKRLLLAVRDTRQVGAVVEMLPCRIHLTTKLSFENNAIVRYPLRQVFINFSDQPIVIANVARDAKQEGEHGTGRAADERDQGIHWLRVSVARRTSFLQAVDLSAKAPPRRAAHLALQ